MVLKKWREMMRLKHFFIVLIMIVWSSVSMAATATLIADTKSGFILSSRNPNAKIFPASLTKVMTLYMAFEALEEGLRLIEKRIIGQKPL